MIYGCHGVAGFVAEQIRVQQLGGETCYAVACDGGRVVGCAEMRCQPNRLFLTYIAIQPDYRRQGLGGRLLHAAIEAAGADAAEFALDVFDFSDGARQWYRHLGLEQRDAFSWCQIAPTDDAPAPVRLSGYAQAQACHRDFGFSQFSLTAADTRYEIGRLGDQWYRLTDASALTVPGLIAAITRLSPQRDVLLVAKTSALDSSPNRASEIARSHRLAGPLATVLQRLTEKELERAQGRQ